MHQFTLTSARSADGNAAMCEAVGVAPGTYDVTLQGESTLMNVKRHVVVSPLTTSVDMGTLLEGDANGDDTVDLNDFVLVSVNWQASQAQVEYDPHADFNRNGIVNTADLSLLAANWLTSSPVEIAP